MKTARDVMQTQVLTLAPHDPLHTVQRLFYEEGIHGAPVVDDEGHVLGILTSTDILRAAADAEDGTGPDPDTFLEDLDFSQAWSLSPETLKLRLQDTVASDYMTEEVIHVSPDMPVSQVARILRESQVHRVLVVENRRLCGIVTAFDLVALLEES